MKRVIGRSARRRGWFSDPIVETGEPYRTVEVGSPSVHDRSPVILDKYGRPVRRLIGFRSGKGLTRGHP